MYWGNWNRKYCFFQPIAVWLITTKSGYANGTCIISYFVSLNNIIEFPYKHLTTLLHIRRHMNSLPAQVKQIIYEYDNTYHEIYDGVMDELRNKTILTGKALAKEFTADYIRINGIKINRILNYHNSVSRAWTMNHLVF